MRRSADSKPTPVKTPVWAFFAKGKDNALLCPPLSALSSPKGTDLIKHNWHISPGAIDDLVRALLADHDAATLTETPTARGGIGPGVIVAWHRRSDKAREHKPRVLPFQDFAV
jgi:hypothetical protein